MRARLVLVPIALVAALLASCTTKTEPATSPTTAAADNGIAALSATEILAKAVTALTNAKSVHIKGDFISDGDTMKADILIHGRDGKASIETGGKTIEVIRVGTDGYFKASAEFLSLLIPPGTQGAPSPDQLALLKDKYIKVPAGNAMFAAFASGIEPSELLKATGTVSKGEAKVVNGVPTITLVDDDAKDGGKLYIATTGEPYPIRLEHVAGGSGLDFAEYGAAVEIKAPPAEQVFDATPFLPKA
jgi:hypothetical protein